MTRQGRRLAGIPAQLRRAGPAIALVLVALAASPQARQTEAQRATGVLTEGVTAVLVDTVVRDRRGRPVTDLTASDFEVLEDGVPQVIQSFTPVVGGGPAPASVAQPAREAAGAVPATLSVADDGTVLVTALVFDRLSPEARRLAVEAAKGYVGAQEQTPQYVAIYGVDLSLRSYAPFTRNARVLREGLETLASRASSAFNQPEQRQQRADAEGRAASQGAAAAAVGGPDGAAAGVEAMLARMEANTLAGFDAMEQSQQGFATMHSLIALVTEMAQLRGRKSLVFFAEELAIPGDAQRHFLRVIDAANRANVSIYAVDAAGLRAESDQAAVRDRVNRGASRGANTAYSGDLSGGPLTRTLELNEEALRHDPAGALGQLAQYTGGLLLNSTNNLKQGLARIDDDLRNYYLLGYTPANQQVDGRFRSIEVRVKRPNVTVAARKGYVAAAGAGPMPGAWETSALEAMARTPVPNAFPVRAAALLFPERGRPGLVPVVVDFRTAEMTFRPDADGATYTSDFGVLVRFLDARNEEVRRVGQHYEINGRLEEIDGAKRGEVVFYREPELPAGTYTMETVVYDVLTGRASVRFSTVEVPPAHEGLRMSSLVLVKGADHVPENERRRDNPLLVNDVVLRPNLGEPVTKSAQEALFYFAVYPAPGGPAPEAMIHVLQNGKPIAQVPMLVGDADAAGRAQQLGQLPLASFEPGTYELEARVRQGTSQVAASTVMRIVE